VPKLIIFGRLRKAAAIAGAIACAAAIASCGSSGYDSAASPTDAGSEATTQVTRLFEAVKSKDKSSLEKLLAPNWYLQRGSGGPLSKSEFINGLPDLTSYELGAVNGSQYQDTLVATYTATTDLVVDGVRFEGTPAPYLSSFIEVDGEWFMLAHGNFNKPK